MAVEWMENFQNYGTGSTGLANMLDGMWAELPAGGSTTYANLVADPDGVSSGNVLRFNSTSDDSPARRVLPSGSQTTVGIAFRWWLSQLPEDNMDTPYMSFYDSTNTAQCTVTVGSTGTLRVNRGPMNRISGAEFIEETATPVITAAAWNHIEIKAVIDDAVGSIEIRVNGATVLNLENIDTKASGNAGCAQIRTGNGYGISNNLSLYIKDMIVWNSVGSTNNDFMGDVQVVTLRPDGDSSFNWTPSTGATGFDLIDELSPDDADYISAADPPPAASVFTLDDLDPDIVTVKALMPVARMWKTDGGTANVQMTLTTNAANDAGADRPITVAATYWFDISELSPDTGVSWTPTEVNNALFSIDRTI